MRIDQLTFTRFAAAMAIVVYHFGRAVPPFNASWLSSFVEHANLSVSYFYILSGFVMIIAYHKRSLQGIAPVSYYQSRFARIYPLYTIGLLLVILYNSYNSLECRPLYIILSLLGLQAWYPPSAVQLNFPGWSISVEIFFYLLFPWLFNRLYLKYKFNKLIIGVLIIWFCSQLFFNLMVNSSLFRDFPSNRANALFYAPLMHLSEFLVGNIAGIFVVKNQNLKLKHPDLYMVLLITVMMLVVKAGGILNFHNGLLAVFIAPFLIVFSLSQGLFSRICSLKPLQFLGEISYGIYILQVPVYLFCYEIFTWLRMEDETLRFYLYSLFLVLTAALLYKMVELPLRNRVKNSRFPPKFIVQMAWIQKLRQ